MRTRGPILLYGASGYTAGLLLPLLEQRRLEVIAAGRDAAKVHGVARHFDIGHRVFDLSQPGAIDEQLKGVALVLNAAGPFVRTAQPMIDACLRRRVDYLDLTGEVPPLEYARHCDGFARSQGVMLLPATGFDVVPTDCLAVQLAELLPEAESLTIGICPSNLVSRGSLSTLVAQAGIPVKVRRAGVLQDLKGTTQLRHVDFGDGARPAVVVTWGDLVTAHHSTGIPNVEVCFEATVFRWLLVMANQYWGLWLQSPAIRSWMQALLNLTPSGPDQTARQAQGSVIVAEVRRNGQCARARLVTPEAYSFTAEAAARAVEAVLEGARRPGFCTPGRLFGPDFVLSVPGVTRQVLE